MNIGFAKWLILSTNIYIMVIQSQFNVSLPNIFLLIYMSNTR
jgi:hypothetical protein